MPVSSAVRTRDPAATRDALLAAGARLFASRGYDGATVQAIADAAGVNPALISYHFGGKQALYTAVLLSAIADAKADLEPVRSSQLPPDRRLREFIAAFARFAQRLPHFPIIVVREEMSGARNMEDEVLAELTGFFDLDREILEEGQRQGVFREVDAHAAHLILVGALVFFFLSKPLRDRFEPEEKLPAAGPELDTYVSLVQDMIVRGLKANSQV